jgi:non-ribosomal peptide synthetase component F
MPVRYSATAGLGGGGSVTCLGGVVACTAAGAPPQCAAVTAVLPDTALAEDAATCERPLFDVFTAVAAGQPDRLAVDDGVVRLTYAELRDRALALGAHIAGKVPVDGLAGVLVPPTTLYPNTVSDCLVGVPCRTPPVSAI